MTKLTEQRRQELIAQRAEVSGKRMYFTAASRFSDLFEFVAVWDHARFNHYNGVAPPERPEGVFVTMPDITDRKGERRVKIELGPFCSVERKSGRYGLAVRPTQELVEHIRPWMFGDPNETWSFSIIDHGEVALVIADSMHLGGPWLTYIDPATIPVPS